MFSIRYFQIKDRNTRFFTIKTGEEIPSMHQVAFSGWDDTVHTTVKKLGMSEHERFEKYLVKHEYIQHINGRYRGEPINYYIPVEELDFFVEREGNTLFAKGRSKPIEEAIRVLEKDNIIQLLTFEVNLTQLMNKLQQLSVTGGWFRNLEIERVESAGVFGSSVSESPLWEEFESKGELSAVLINTILSGKFQSVMITRKASILFYEQWDEKYCLEKACNLFEIIKPCLVAVS